MKNKYAILIPVAVCAGAIGRDLLPKAMKWVTEKKKDIYKFSDELIMDKTYFDNSDSHEEKNYRMKCEAIITEDNEDVNLFPDVASLTITDNRINVESIDGYKESFCLDDTKEILIKTSYAEC